MFHILPRSKGRIVGVQALGRLCHEDYVFLLPRLESLIAQHGRLRVLFHLGGFEWVDPHAAWDDLMFGLRHWNDLERMAIVGEAGWESLLARVMAEIAPVETRYFDVSRVEEAWAWLESTAQDDP
ncbi:STAS/SEC14 domain-containing protein [Magnetospira thiophila]